MVQSWGVFSHPKDRLIEHAALSYLNVTRLASHGRATSLRLNSTAKTSNIEVELKGEAPLQIEITDYDIRKDGDRYFAIVKRIRNLTRMVDGVGQKPTVR